MNRATNSRDNFVTKAVRVGGDRRDDRTGEPDEATHNIALGVVTATQASEARARITRQGRPGMGRSIDEDIKIEDRKVVERTRLYTWPKPNEPLTRPIQGRPIMPVPVLLAGASL